MYPAIKSPDPQAYDGLVTLEVQMCLRFEARVPSYLWHAWRTWRGSEEDKQMMVRMVCGAALAEMTSRLEQWNPDGGGLHRYEYPFGHASFWLKRELAPE